LQKQLKKAFYAYHVAFRTQDEAKLTTLNPHPANDLFFDDCLFGLPLVFLSTTLREGKFPLYSLYPTHGKSMTKYQRYKVPLTTFDNVVAYVLPKKQSQVHIVFLPPNHDLQPHFDSLVAARKIEHLNLLENEFLTQKRRDRFIDWFVNEYDDDKTFVNIAYPDPLELAPNSCDHVTKGKQGTNNAKPTPSYQVVRGLWIDRQCVLAMQLEIAQLKAQLASVKATKQIEGTRSSSSSSSSAPSSSEQVHANASSSRCVNNAAISQDEEESMKRAIRESLIDQEQENIKARVLNPAVRAPADEDSDDSLPLYEGADGSSLEGSDAE
jgi:hypothetical protein